VKNLILTLAIVLSYNYSNAQLFTLEHDHSTIQVEDIEQSAKFYAGILNLKELETPWPENQMIRFFETGKNQQLHIAQVDNYGDIKVNKVLHLAFAVKDFNGYLKYLSEHNISYFNFNGEVNEVQQRPDGVRQIYLLDPDSYWIEINDAKH